MLAVTPYPMLGSLSSCTSVRCLKRPCPLNTTCTPRHSPRGNDEGARTPGTMLQGVARRRYAGGPLCEEGREDRTKGKGLNGGGPRALLHILPCTRKSATTRALFPNGVAAICVDRRAGVVNCPGRGDGCRRGEGIVEGEKRAQKAHASEECEMTP